MFEQESVTVKLMVDTFQRELGSHLSRNEINQLFYILAGQYLKWTKSQVHLEPDFMIPGETSKCFREALQRLSRHEPIEYITGTSSFNGNKYIVNPSVLIPRPETEELCNIIVGDLSVDKYKEVAILDLGTGSGCIAIDLKTRLQYAKVTAVDNSKDALETARQNASRHGVELSFALFDVLDSSNHHELGMFDVIVSNPPICHQQ
jgi:release factor glutamine methyltransferase